MTKKRYRRRPSVNEQQIAAIDRFSVAVVSGTRDELTAATGDLLEIFANTAQRLVTQAVHFLIEAQKTDREMMSRMREQMELQQRHLEQIDLILDEQARSRTVGE